MHFAVYISDTPVTLKQSQGHQTYNDNVEPKKVITMQSLKDLALKVSKKKPLLKVFFFKQGNISIVSLEHMQKKKKKKSIIMV